MSSNYQTNRKNTNNFKNKGKKREKFVPNFKKRVPTGKLIDQEVNELVPKYDQVWTINFNHLNCFFFY